MRRVVFAVALAPLAVAIATVGGGGAAATFGVVGALGLAGVLLTSVARRAGRSPTLFTWQQVDLDLERQLRRALRRRHWRRRLGLGVSGSDTRAGRRDEKTNA